MASFLFSIWPETGHVYPSLAVAFALRDAGHDVAYVTTARYRDLVEAHGIACFPHNEILSRPTTRPEAARQGAVHAIAAGYREQFIDRLPADIAVLQEIVASWRPDVLVHDPVSLAPAIVAELARLPVATLSVTTFSWPGRDFGPFGLGLPPATDDETRARYTALRRRTDDAFAIAVDGLNEVRAAAGLAPKEGPLPVATLSPYLVMVPTVPAFDYNRTDLPPQAHYIGPCLWDPPAALDEVTANWLATLPADQPVALVTASTAMKRTAALVEAALPALSRAGLAVLSTLPFDHPLHDSMLPPRTHLARFVPYDAVMPRCTVMVSHSGFGTVTKALGYRLPLVVVPYASDQLEVAQRAASAGAAIRLDPAQIDGTTLSAAVDAVLHDVRYRASVERLAAALAAQDGPAAAVSLLAQLARDKMPILRRDNTPPLPGIQAVTG